MNELFFDCKLATSPSKLEDVKQIPYEYIGDENILKIKGKKIKISKDYYEEKIKNRCKNFNNENIGNWIIFVGNKNHIVICFEEKDDGVVSIKQSKLIEFDSCYLIELSNSNIYRKDKDIIKTIYDEKQKILNGEKILSNILEKQLSEANITGIGKKIEKQKCLVNLNEQVKKDKTVVVGFENEIKELIKGLMMMRKPNVMIKGLPGVGKTALVEKLAILINNGKVPDLLKNKVIYQLYMSSAVAGTKYRGEFEEKLEEIIKLVESNQDIILFIDEAHTMVGAGGAEGAIDASNILKPALARGKIKVIGATTNKEYDEFIKKDEALTRRFNNIEVFEPTKDDVKKIMIGLKSKMENFYNLKISDKIINEIYDKAKMKNGMMPDIALDELDKWCVERVYN